MSSPANWGALLKRTFGPPVNPIASQTTVASDIDFQAQEDRPGDTFTFPVRLQHEAGGTYNVDHSAFTLNSSIDSVEKQASIEGSEIAVTGVIPTGMMTKMSKTKGEGPRAYDQAMARKILYLMEAAELRREGSLLYGSGTGGLSNLGVVNSVVSAAGTTVVVTITRASWIGGLWTQLIGFQFDFHTSGGTSHSANGPATLTAVNKTNTRLTFTVNAADTATVAVADQLRFRGSRVLDCVGLEAILNNSGSLFGIDAAVYPQWRAEQYAVGGALTFDKVVEGLAGAYENGAEDGVTLYVNGRQWTDLMTDEAALRRRPGEKKITKISTGASELEFESLVGVIKIKVLRFMKQGIAMAIPTKRCMRVGSTDITFSAPGSKNEWFYFELPTQMGCQLRAYSDQGVICEVPYHATLFTGISSTSDTIPA